SRRSEPLAPDVGTSVALPSYCSVFSPGPAITSAAAGLCNRFACFRVVVVVSKITRWSSVVAIPTSAASGVPWGETVEMTPRFVLRMYRSKSSLPKPICHSRGVALAGDNGAGQDLRHAGGGCRGGGARRNSDH